MSRSRPYRSHPCHRRVPEPVDRLKRELVLPVNLKLVTVFKNILSRWLHIGYLTSHMHFSFSFFFFFFLSANSTCWPISFFYRPTQRVGLSLISPFFLLANSTCWPITLQPDGSHRLFVTRLPTCSGNTS